MTNVIDFKKQKSQNKRSGKSKQHPYSVLTDNPSKDKMLDVATLFSCAALHLSEAAVAGDTEKVEWVMDLLEDALQDRPYWDGDDVYLSVGSEDIDALLEQEPANFAVYLLTGGALCAEESTE